MYLMDEEPPRVLFVCIGNMCRSQMAEGLARAWADGRVRVWSAGTHSSGVVAEHAVAALAEIGIDIREQWSKGLEDVDLGTMDVVVSMGSTPAATLVPRGFSGRLIDWRVHDPIGEPLEAFREVRDDLTRRVHALIDQLVAEHDAELGERTLPGVR